MTKICILQGHPHGTTRGGGAHLCHALADAYAAAAVENDHAVERVDISALDVPTLYDPADFTTAANADVQSAQQALLRCEHLVVFYPLWMGTMPALVKAFFEQVGRAGFAISPNPEGGWPLRNLAGRSARVVVTMGMPAAAYRLLFGADGVKGFESGILGISGFKPVRETLLGMVENAKEGDKKKWFAKMRELGAKAG